MKKLVSILLLCAMLISTLSMGIVVSAEENNVTIGAVNPGADESKFRTELDEDYVLYRSSKGPDKAFWTNARSQGLTEIHITTAEQLYGWVKYRADAANRTDTFEGVTIYLDVDVNLNGATWDAIHGDCLFKGNFDGQGHVISNYKMSVGSWNKSFFGRVAGAYIQNLSLTDVTFAFGRKDASNLTNLALLVSTAEPDAEKTLTIKNVYVNGTMSMTTAAANTTKSNHDIGGLVGVVSKGTVVIENCKFEGTITDVANTKVVAQKVGGLIGSVNASATLTLRNCEADATIDVGGATLGGLIANSTATAEITIENCAFNGTVKSRMAKTATTNIGGFIGNITGTSKLTIKNSQVNATVGNVNADAYDVRVASGMIGNLGAATTEIKNCTVKGEITATSRCSGMIAVPSSAGAITVQNCDVDVQLYAKSGLASGIYTNGNDQKGDVIISNCKVAGKIHAATAVDADYAVAGVFCRIYTAIAPFKISISDCDVTMDIEAGKVKAGGIIGLLKAPSKSANNYTSIVVKNCTYAGDIVGTRGYTGGVIGHLAGTTKDGVAISNCVIEGSITSGGYAGGLVGLSAGGSALSIKDCTVSANLEFAIPTTNFDSKSATVTPNGAGALIGAIKSGELRMYRNVFNGTATFSFNAAELETETVEEVETEFQPDSPCYAGGLVGAVLTGSKVYLNNNNVAGAITAENLDTVTDAKDQHAVAMLIGGIEPNPEGVITAKVFYGKNNTYDATKAKDSGVEVILTSADAPLNTNVIGFQTKENGDGTYDLRYVIGMNDVFEGVGVRANLRFLGEDKSFSEKYVTCYVDTVYASVQDGEGNTYAASDYLFDYLYTLVIKNIPSSINVEDKTLQVLISTFGATEENEEITWVKGGFAVQGGEIVNTAAQDQEFRLDNFATELDAKFTAENAIVINGADFDTNVSEGTASTTAGKGECLVGSGYDDGTLEIPRHYYMDAGNTGADVELLRNLTYSFEVEKTGWYDLCIDMRMKADGEKETNSRKAMMMIDWKGGADAYYLHFDLEGVGAIKTASAGSYMTGLSVYLEAGEHTITFGIDSRMGSNFHLRNIYLAEVVEE